MSDPIADKGLVGGSLIFTMVFDPEKEPTTANLADADNWLPPCGLTQHSVSQGINVSETKVFKNCNPHDGNESETISASAGKRPMTISASGPMKWEMAEVYQAIHNAGEAHPFRVMLNRAGYHGGMFLLETFEMSGKRDEPTAQVSISLRSAANPVWVAASAPPEED